MLAGDAIFWRRNFLSGSKHPINAVSIVHELSAACNTLENCQLPRCSLPGCWRVLGTKVGLSGGGLNKLLGSLDEISIAKPISFPSRKYLFPVSTSCTSVDGKQICYIPRPFQVRHY